MCGWHQPPYKLTVTELDAHSAEAQQAVLDNIAALAEPGHGSHQSLVPPNGSPPPEEAPVAHRPGPVRIRRADEAEDDDVWEPEYEVDRVKDHRRVEGGQPFEYQYLVVWVGYPEDEATWEPAGYLAKEVVENYWLRSNLSKGKSKKEQKEVTEMLKKLDLKD